MQPGSVGFASLCAFAWTHLALNQAVSRQGAKAQRIAK